MASSSTVIGLLRVLLSANTAEFDANIKKSATVATSFEATVKGVAKSLKDLSGQSTISAANNIVAALEKLGGISKLTAAEQQRVNEQVTAAIEKYKALGMEAPKALTDLASATKQVEQPTSRLNNLLGDFGSTFKATLAGFISAQAIIGGVTKAWEILTDFVAGSIKAFSDQEAAVKKMTTALQAQGTATPETIASYKAMAAQFQQTTVHADELINEMQALLVQVGGVMPAEMKGALQAATDLSSGLGSDLRQATLLVGKAFEGETGTLKRYGIVIDETKLKTQGVTAVLDAIQAKFGGQAQAEAETYAGKLKQIANAWGELQETTGEIIITNPILEATIRELQEALQGGTGAVIDHTHSWSNLLAEWSRFSGGFAPLAVLIRQLEDAADAANRAAKAAKFSPEFIKPAIGHQTQAEADAARQRENDKKAAEAMKIAAAAAEAYRKAIQALRMELSGAKLQHEVKQLSDAFQGLSKEQRESAKVIDRTADAAHKLWEQGAILTPTLFRLVIENGNLADSLPPVEKGLGQVAQAGQLVNDHFKNTLAIVEALIPKLKVVAGLGPEFRGVGAIPVPTAPDVEPAFAEAYRRAQQFQKDMIELGKDAGLGVSAAIADGIVSGDWSQLEQNLRDVLAHTIGSALTNAVNFLIPGLGTILGPIFDAFGSLISNAFGDRGRDMVEAFAGTHGGFDALHKKLQETFDPATAERFWIALTQGVGRNNPEQAAAIIRTITDAFADAGQAASDAARAQEETARDLMGTLNADELKALSRAYRDAVLEGFRGSKEEFFQQQLELLETVGGGDARLKLKFTENTLLYSKLMKAGLSDLADDFKSEIDKLTSEIDSLTQSIADEAPEEVMGVVEAQTRARIAAIEEERERIQEELRQAAEAVGEEAEAVGQTVDEVIGGAIRGIGDDLRENLKDWEAWRRYIEGITEHLHIMAPVPEPPDGGMPGFAGGTHGRFLDFGSGTPVWLHGKERIETEAEAMHAAPAGLSEMMARDTGPMGAYSSTTILEVDKRALGRVIADVLPGELRRLGVRVVAG